MTTFLIKSMICMAILLAFYYIFMEREKMHTFNRFYLIGAIIISFILPSISIPVYVDVVQPAIQQSEVILHNPATVITNTKPIIVSAPPVNYLPYILIAVYVLVTLLLFVRFIKTIRQFYILEKSNKTVKYKGTTLVLLDICPMPHTFLNNIYFSKPAYENNAIEPELFTHELTHVHQKHTLDILFIEVLKIIFWFNPLLYLYKKAIKLNHEFLADKKVIEMHANTLCYQNLLLEKAIVGTTFSIASNLNFLITKKRFIMMTKTTSKVRGMVLKIAILPLFAGLVYAVSTKTIAQIKNTGNPTAKTEKEPAPKQRTFTNVEDAMAYLQEEEMVKASAAIDTLTGDTRRDEFFKGVQIIINDESRGVNINKPYEKLTPEQKRYYLNDVPEKKKAKGVDEGDYTFLLEQKNAYFYIDDNKVTREELLKHSKKDFASSAFKMTGEWGPGDKKTEIFQAFFYTFPHFNKYLKHVNDHYPGKIYQLNIAKTIVNDKDISLPLNESNIVQKAKNDVAAPAYPNTKEIEKSSHNISFSYPGGMNAFYQYFYSNFKAPANESRKDFMINFYINTDGSVSDVFTGDKNEALNKEITRVLLSTPKWIPAQRNGRPIKMSTSIKVSF